MKNGLIEVGHGNYMWYKDDKLHRLDGPAAIHRCGSKLWWVNGKRHREDGPAAEFFNGEIRWYFYDIEYSLNDWLKNHPTMTDSEKVLFKLIWG